VSDPGCPQDTGCRNCHKNNRSLNTRSLTKRGIRGFSTREIKEYTLDVLGGWWPEFYLVGTLPAAGFYLRHIDGVHLENIQLFTVSDDARPPFVFDDVKNGRGTELYLNNKLSKISQNE